MPETIDLQAVLPQPPPTLPPWAKVLWYLAETVAIGVTYLQFDSGQEIQPTAGTPDDPTATTWRRFQMVYENNISVERADDQVFTIDLVNYTNNAIDNTWTPADYTVCDTNIGVFCATLVSVIPTWLTLTQIRAYRMTFNPYTNPKPFAASGAPEYMSTKNVPGTGGGLVAPQATTTVTELTPVRKHWGRFYLPTMASSVYAAGGRLATAQVDAIAAAANKMYGDLAANQFYPVVPVVQVDKQPVRALQGVTQVRVDDVGDVVRRRRYRSPNHTKTLP